MIVIKEKDTVYFAYATGHHSYYTTLRFDDSEEENMSLWHLNDGKGTIVMLDARSDRIADLLRYSDIFDLELTVEALCGLRAQIVALYRGANCREIDGCIGVVVFIARGSQVFRVYGDGSVEEVESFVSGHYYEDAFSAAYEHCRAIEDPHERIAAIYDMVEAHTGRRAEAVAVINTKDDSYTILPRKAG